MIYIVRVLLAHSISSYLYDLYFQDLENSNSSHVGASIYDQFITAAIGVLCIITFLLLLDHRRHLANSNSNTAVVVCYVVRC